MEWTASDFEGAITRLSEHLCNNEETGSWSICKGCLEAKISRPGRVSCSSHSIDITADDAFLCTDDSIISDCDSVSVTSLPKQLWSFSIAYSYTWRVPVMYFSVQLPDGTPCSRDEVIGNLRCFCNNNEIVNDSWDFVSSDEHPVTGIPSFFLHPCRTSHILETLNASTTCSAMRLWSWLSMISPTVGLSIAPKTFSLVKVQLHKV